MKKMEYFAPEMEMIEMKYNQIICASGDGNTIDNGGSGNPDDPDDQPA